jgi:hypothetical protein
VIRRLLARLRRLLPRVPSRFVTPYLAGAITVLLVLNLIGVAETRTFTTKLRNGLVESCEKNGNPLREGLRLEKETEITERENPEPQILKALHLTRDQAIELAQPQIAKLRLDIKTRYKRINCEDEYR